MRLKHISPANSAICVIVLTSEATWEHLASYCFNASFEKKRAQFDLCVAFNGTVSDVALQLLSEQHPEHIIVRPNQGMDPAALDECIKNIPSYEYYVVMHDDHWFSHDTWLEQLLSLMQMDTSTAAYGNLVTSCPYDSHEFEEFFNIVSATIGYEDYHNKEFPHYLQGMAGIFQKNAIEQLLRRDGVPHTHGNHKKTVEVCERLLSYVLLKDGAVLKQLPPGYELFLRHRQHNGTLAESSSLLKGKHKLPSASIGITT